MKLVESNFQRGPKQYLNARTPLSSSDTVVSDEMFLKMLTYGLGAPESLVYYSKS